MNEFLMTALEHAAAAVSLLLMGACGVGLALRLLRVLRGQEAADGLTCRSAFAPGASLLAAAGVGLLSRLALYGLAYAMYRLLGVGNDGPLESLAPLWTHWDTRHYIGIAQEGYTAVGDERLRLVFFPLYPALMRLVSPLTGGNLFAAGLLVSLACSAAATALVYDLSYLHFGRRTARRSVAYFLLSPLSVFLCCAYTEALFICLTLAAVCLLRRGHPWLAALCGALSALTRMPGVIVAGLFIVETLGKIPQKRANARALLACAGQVLLVFSGLLLADQLARDGRPADVHDLPAGELVPEAGHVLGLDGQYHALLPHRRGRERLAVDLGLPAAVHAGHVPAAGALRAAHSV